MEAALQWPKGKVYLIICKQGDQALRIQQNDPLKYEKSRVIGCKPNSNDNGQLFIIEKQGQKVDDFQILNCVSCKVFDQESKEIKLRSGSMKSDQLFAVEESPVQAFYKYFWIKTSAKGDLAVELQGVLRYSKFDPNKESQLFRFEPVNDNFALQNSSIIINNYSGKVIDVPEASFKKEVKIIQWEKNKRFNQRWRFVKSGQGYMIQSLLNNFALDIAGAKKKDGTKIIQWDAVGDTNQLWFPEKCGPQVYKFRSLHDSSLFLSVHNQSLKDGEHLQVSTQQNPAMYWKIEGALP